MNGTAPTPRVIRITGSARPWVVYVSSTDTLTPSAQIFLADGWLSMREYAILEAQIDFSHSFDRDGRTDGEWLNAALFGKLTPKPKFDDRTRQLAEPPGLTQAQRLNLGWAKVGGVPVVGAYEHLPNFSPFISYVLQGGAGCPEIAAAGKLTLGQLQTTLAADGRIAQDDKQCLWQMFVVSAIADGTLSNPPNLTGFPGVVLPTMTPSQILAYQTVRANYRVYGPIFTFVTGLLGAGFPGP